MKVLVVGLGTVWGYHSAQIRKWKAELTTVDPVQKADYRYVEDIPKNEYFDVGRSL